MNNAKQFEWERYPNAEKIIVSLCQEVLNKNSEFRHLADSMHRGVSLNILDWIDHFRISYSSNLQKKLTDNGFKEQSMTEDYKTFKVDGSYLPRIVVDRSSKSEMLECAIGVEHIEEFLGVRGISNPIEGSPFSGYRKCMISEENDSVFLIVEREGTQTLEPTYSAEGYLDKYFSEREKWIIRPRNENFDSEISLRYALALAKELVQNLGKNRAAAMILSCERRYWELRNTAARYQKNRQDLLGLGWGNHDHHTFRCARKNLPMLVELFETVGFHCREQFYAGEEAGWGAQVMENPVSGASLFLDIDLASEELDVDFAHEPLPDREELGTVGLWCELHGDSIATAGLHHLAGRYDFSKLFEDFKRDRLKIMDPFSNFDYLKQAFSVGELWQVSEEKLTELERAGRLTAEQSDKIETHGALGSHIENIQRKEGFKGFNQHTVSTIIKKTDPRKN